MRRPDPGHGLERQRAFAKQVYRTTDGGQSWVQQTAGGPPGTAYTGVHAVSATTAWIAGWYGYVARTTDAGQTWQSESIPGGSGAFWECAAFLDAERGWVAGDAGIFFRDAAGACSGVASYCTSTPNSTGSPARIDWSGSCVAATNDFTLLAAPVPDQPFLFFFGPGQTQVPFGNGVLCVSGGLKRILPPEFATGNVAERKVDLAQYGLTAGTTVNFQCWFRDPAAGGAKYDSSDALAVTFE